MFYKTRVVAVSLLGICIQSPDVYSSVIGVKMPHYNVISKDKNFEIRHYEALIIAQTMTSGDRQSAARQAFKKLFGYISGQNNTHEKITMTSPVLQQAHGSMWRVAFIMPNNFRINELPKPLDSHIQLENIKSSDYYCMRFSGRLTDENLEIQLKRFQTHLQDKHYKIVGVPLFAFYDPPWTLPFLRRNEIWGKAD